MEEKAYCRGCNCHFDIFETIGEYYVQRMPDGSKRWHPAVDCNVGVIH